MTIRHALLRASFLLPMLFGAPPNAGAVTLEEYDSMEGEDKVTILEVIVVAYYEHYSGNPDTAYLATCMDDLYGQVDADGGSRLMNLIGLHLDDVRGESDPSYSVEKAVGTVIDRECQSQ